MVFFMKVVHICVYFLQLFCQNFLGGVSLDINLKPNIGQCRKLHPTQHVSDPFCMATRPVALPIYKCHFIFFISNPERRTLAAPSLHTLSTPISQNSPNLSCMSMESN
ncbi:hypothetical protein ACOSP7_014189 [Xanthoceras sorbifolium]